MKDERPDAWQPTPKLRWLHDPSKLEFHRLFRAALVLQQLWYIPNSEQYEWRDVPAEEEAWHGILRSPNSATV